MSKKHLILIVEDEAVLQDVYELVLSSQGYEVSTASNGVEGIAQMKKAPPDLVLLDVLMPVMDGKEFLKNIDLQDYPDTKIIAYSNLSDSKTEEEMRKLGADNFILKSDTTPQELVSLVAETLIQNRTASPDYS